MAVNTCYASWRPLETDKTVGWRVGRCEGVSYSDVFKSRSAQLKLQRCAGNALEVPSLFAFYSNQIVHWSRPAKIMVASGPSTAHPWTSLSVVWRESGIYELQKTIKVCFSLQCHDQVHLLERLWYFNLLEGWRLRSSILSILVCRVWQTLLAWRSARWFLLHWFTIIKTTYYGEECVFGTPNWAVNVSAHQYLELVESGKVPMSCLH